MPSYKVKSGDTLGKISVSNYGTFNDWAKIRDANPQLAGRKTATDGSPLIYPGDVLVIPEKTNIPPAAKNSAPIALDKTQKQDVSIYVDGKMFTGFTGYTIDMPADSFDSFSMTAPFDSSISKFREAFMPFSYKPCCVYYDGKKLFNGTLLTPNPSVSPDSRTITLQGYPLCGVINEAHLPVSKYPPSYKGMTLTQIAKDMTAPFGFGVKIDGNEGDAFEDVEYDPGETIISFLNKLAGERGLVMTNDADGNLLFWQPKESSVTASFIENELPFVSCTPTFNGQNFFSHVTGFSKVESTRDTALYTYENTFLTKQGVLRPYSYMVEDAKDTNLEASVKAKATRMFATSVSYDLTVFGHKDKNKSIYKKGSFVSLKTPSAFVFHDTKLLIDSVQLTRSDSEGDQTKMKLVLPGARIPGSLPTAFPWED